MYNKLLLSTATVLRLVQGQGVAFHDLSALQKVISPALLFRAIEEPLQFPGERALPENVASCLLLTSVPIFLIARDRGESRRFHPN